MITAATALALNLDVEVANNVANNALKNNMGLAARLGLEVVASELVVAALRTHVGLAILQALSIATLTEQAKDGPSRTLVRENGKIWPPGGERIRALKVGAQPPFQMILSAP